MTLRAARSTTTPDQERGLEQLDEAFLYSESIDVTSYSRQRDKLRDELTLVKIEHHAEAVDELDVQGILAFAERIELRVRLVGEASRQSSAAGRRKASRRRCRRPIGSTSMQSFAR